MSKTRYARAILDFCKAILADDQITEEEIIEDFEDFVELVIQAKRDKQARED